VMTWPKRLNRILGGFGGPRRTFSPGQGNWWKNGGEKKGDTSLADSRHRKGMPGRVVWGRSLVVAPGVPQEFSWAYYLAIPRERDEVLPWAWRQWLSWVCGIKYTQCLFSLVGPLVSLWRVDTSPLVAFSVVATYHRQRTRAQI
jgi:hypothetical protein